MLKSRKKSGCTPSDQGRGLGCVEDLSDHRCHIASDNRFHQQFPDAEACGLFLIDFVAEAGAEYNRNVRPHCHQLNRQFIAGQVRHGHVGDDQVELGCKQYR